jgi:hypothetical protein
MLPEGFEHLEHLVDRWAGETIQDRWMTRSEASYRDIQKFYDEMLPAADAALRHVEGFPITELPPAEGMLFRLLLSLSHAAMAIEVHGQARAPHSPWPHGIRVARAPAPFA